MSSFFLKGNVKSGSKRKVNKKQKAGPAPKKVPKAAKQIDDEEIDSDEAFNSDDQKTIHSDSDGDQETAQDKRLRLAKQYLEEIEKEEAIRAEDTELHDHVSQRLKEEYLEKIGKLKKTIADQYTGYNEATIKFLKHKSQKLPITCVIISSNNEFLFSGSKTSFLVKWHKRENGFQSIAKFDFANTSGEQTPVVGKKRRPHVVAMCLTTDMKFLAVADGGNDIKILCPSEMKHLKTLKGHRDVVTSLVFRRDTHQLYSGSRDRSVKIWSCDDMSYIESLFGHQAGITGIDALTRERAITCGGTDCSIRIWKIVEESQLIFNGHKGIIESVKLINDENFLSSGDDGSLCVWGTLKKKPLCVVPLVHGISDNGEANWISAIATLVNTDLMASGSSDGNIRLWKMSDNGRRLTQLFEIPIKGFVNSLAFTNNGSHIIAGVGQEHRLGRWWHQKDAKNSILVIELQKKSTDNR